MSTLNWSPHQPTLHTVTATGKNIILRPWNISDADAVFRACQDPGITRWTTTPDPYLPEHAASFIEASTFGPWDSASGANFAVANEATDEVVASCGFVRGEDAHSRAEIGYWVAPWARRQGIAAAAVRALTRWGFEDLGLERIIIEAATDNEASQRVALSSGFIWEGIQRAREQKEGHRNDLVLFSRLPSDPQFPE
ncbi:GNAT family N-acetyltransferase [Lysinibacter cavernae]|uniref:RimJ/RimL family protein N-acetyltransferase n=1 Tax=Lysinibacter cavernae TaxID=1640652 RepID=A0A7X5QYD5_9MICO|nr:GNAT family N-acetyltransferase [Lysinibacter cavernae]NIH52181.1 RimJ/RimL family protein N-acetyltransferase [Lysinibacter cavernae]